MQVSINQMMQPKENKLYFSSVRLKVKEPQVVTVTGVGLRE
jgi:hypothetical protein